MVKPKDMVIDLGERSPQKQGAGDGSTYVNLPKELAERHDFPVDEDLEVKYDVENDRVVLEPADGLDDEW